MYSFFFIIAIVTWHETIGSSIDRNSYLNLQRQETDDYFGKSVFADYNRFSTDLFKTAYAKKSSNFAVSPSAPFVSLSMAIPCHSANENRQPGYRKFLENFQRFPNFYQSENNFFYDNGNNVPTEFINAVRENFGSEPKIVNFDNPEETSASINDWYRRKSDSLSNIVEPGDLKPQTKAVFVNTVHFKGFWPIKFLLSKENEDFQCSDSKSTRVPYMKLLWFLNSGILSDPPTEFIEIPYEYENSDEELSLFILLPQNVGDVPRLVQKMSDFTMDQLTASAAKETLLSMPAFTITSKTIFEDPLINRPLSSVFSNAECSANHENPGHVSKLIQKVVIEVNEKSKNNYIMASPVPGQKIHRVNVNRTFCFIVGSKGKNPAILVNGCYDGST